MPTDLATSFDFAPLIEALGLSPLTTKFELIIEAESLPLIRTESYVETDVKGELIKRMDEYRLVRREID